MVYLPTFTYLYHEFIPNVGKYAIHGMGNDLLFLSLQINYPLFLEVEKWLFFAKVSTAGGGGGIFYLHDYGRKGNITF